MNKKIRSRFTMGLCFVMAMVMFVGCGTTPGGVQQADLKQAE